MLSEVIANESDSKRSVGVVRKPSSSRCARSTQSSVPPAASSPAASSARMLPRTTSRIRPAVQLVPVCGGVGLSAVSPSGILGEWARSWASARPVRPPDGRNAGGGNAGRGCGAIGYALAALKDWTFILGPGFIVGLGNGLILGYLMYRSGLVPRPLAVLGLVGGPLICISGVAVMFGVIDQGGTAQGLATIPEFFWELGLGIYLTVKGFRPSPILEEDAWPVPRTA